MTKLKLKNYKGNSRKPAPDFMPFMRKRGYTMFLHGALERIMSNDFGLKKNEIQVALAVIRKTWGFQRWEDRISLSQIEKMTQIDTRTVSRCLNSLERRRVLVRADKHSWRNMQATEWAVQKDTTLWIEHTQSALGGNPALSPRGNPTQRLGVNRPTTIDTLRDKRIYTQTADKEAEALKQLRLDGRYAV